MATSYKDIKRQIADLEKKAVELRRSEVARVIATIKARIADYGLSVADLFSGTGLKRRGRKPGRVGLKSVNPPKYMDPATGKTWTGHGKAPGWISAAIKKGRKDDFLIANVEAAKTAKPAAAPKTRRKAATKPAVSDKPAGNAKKNAAKGSRAARKPVAAKASGKTPAAKRAVKAGPAQKDAAPNR